MCGIAAVIGERGANTLEKAQMAIASLRHRGPDGIGFWQSKDERITLSLARLSTIDLLSGARPVANEDETVVAVVSGEFYGFEEIRGKLQSFGHAFRTKTDSELLVHLYERYGTSCLDRLHGEFAFVLWDEREQCSRVDGKIGPRRLAGDNGTTCPRCFGELKTLAKSP